MTTSKLGSNPGSKVLVKPFDAAKDEAVVVALAVNFNDSGVGWPEGRRKRDFDSALS